MNGLKVKCSGPDPAVLESLTRQCSCMGEWYFHSRVFTAALALLMYILLYIAWGAM